MKKRRITNTARAAEENPLAVLAASAVLGPSQSIEAMEALGQRELCASEQLPTDGCDVEALTKLGFQIGEVLADDPLFRAVTLPAGWKLAPTDHSMWSDLVDAKGRKRAAVFYKAAFYDRKAHMRMEQRYIVRYADAPAGEPLPDVYVVVDTTSGAVLHSVEFSRTSGESWKASETARGAAQAWLDKRFPNNTDVAAYWDEPSIETPCNQSQTITLHDHYRCQVYNADRTNDPICVLHYIALAAWRDGL